MLISFDSCSQMRRLIDKDFGEFQYKWLQLKNPPIIVYIDNFYNTLLEIYYATFAT